MVGPERPALACQCRTRRIPTQNELTAHLAAACGAERNACTIAHDPSALAKAHVKPERQHR